MTPKHGGEAIDYKIALKIYKYTQIQRVSQ